MNKRALLSILVLVLAMLNIASIRRNEDPIRQTQTDPIAYQQKMEEEKDGKKGPLAYRVRYNPENDFLTASPVASSAEESSPIGSSTEAEPSTANWWEEVPAAERQPVEPAAAAPSEPAPDEYPLEEQPKETSGTESPDAASKSTEDYWW